MTTSAALTPYLDRLRDLPFVREARIMEPKPRGVLNRSPTRARAHPTVALETPTGKRRCPCEHHASHLGRETAEHLVLRAHDTPDLLVFAPSVGRDVGDLFAREGVNFIDLAGNCHLRLGDQYIARIQGQRAEPSPKTDKGLRAPSYAALLALLIEPELANATTRAIAQAAGGMSPQTASDLRTRLVERGVLLRARGRYRWATDGWRTAFDLWLAGWTASLLPRLLVGRYRARERDLSALEMRLTPALDAATAWRWGGGAAAHRLTGYFRGDRTVVYVENPSADLPRRLGFVPDATGPIALVRAPGPLAFRSEHSETVHPLLVYADLLDEGDERARDAAREIYQRFLATRMEQA